MELKVVYEEFITYLEAEDKITSVNYAMSKINKGEISVINLYEHVLAPALNNMICHLEDKRLCIWKEHVRSSIVRTIIECCYPYIIEEKTRREVAEKGERVIIVCPTEEYHELGARIGADYFTLLGYDTIFVGSNTPEEDLLRGVEALKPEYVVVSVSNYYNLVSAKKLTEKIKTAHPAIVVIAAGLAFKEHKENYKKVGADMFIDTFEDVVALRRKK
jgi:methanogenic corrinoid protein MtbC1